MSESTQGDRERDARIGMALFDFRWWGYGKRYRLFGPDWTECLAASQRKWREVDDCPMDERASNWDWSLPRYSSNIADCMSAVRAMAAQEAVEEAGEPFREWWYDNSHWLIFNSEADFCEAVSAKVDELTRGGT